MVPFGNRFEKDRQNLCPFAKGTKIVPQRTITISVPSIFLSALLKSVTIHVQLPHKIDTLAIVSIFLPESFSDFVLWNQWFG